jgi:sterol desaturase/sphingolipid hydroxylase (fatty acid hydroxylase superfamily)
MEAIVSIAIPVIFFLALVFEWRLADRKQPKVRFWLLKGIFFFMVSGLLNALIPAGVAVAVGTHAPLHLASLGTVQSAIVAFLVGDLVNYVVHRFMHNVHFVWRWTHQMHHSAERMDLAGMAYAHPLDSLFMFGLNGLATGLLGLSPAAGALAGFIGFLYAVIQHANVKTPWWIGYVVQRPEAHKVHHTRGVHAFNYGSFPLWDILFGTFRNPREVDAEFGFYDGASSRMGAMLIGRDVGERPISS